MKKRSIRKTRNKPDLFSLILWVLLPILISCQGNKKPKEIITADFLLRQAIQKSLACVDSAITILQDGDIILRTGNDVTSQVLKQFNRQDDSYSHCGIVFKEADSFFVYHAIGGETNPQQTLQREWLPRFCDGAANRGFGIYRFSLDSTSLQREKQYVKEKFTAGTLFDLQFNLQTDDSLYCSEFVVKALQYACQKHQLFDTTFAAGKAYFAVDNIFLNTGGHMIHRYTFYE